MRIIRSLLLVFMASHLLLGCASFGKSLKGFLGGDTEKKVTKSGVSQQAVGKIDKNKNYKRVNHESLQEESRLGAGSGSLWIERGQGAYLFAQNTNRLVGDLVNVEIEGQAKKQIETKVNVIQSLVDKIKAQQEARRLAALKGQSSGKSQAKTKKAPAPAAPAKGGQQEKFDVKTVPTRITDVLRDGSYMVEGDQPFMIGKREYKLVVKGIVRQEDFDDQGIKADTLLDPKFDIVTNRAKR